MKCYLSQPNQKQQNADWIALLIGIVATTPLICCSPVFAESKPLTTTITAEKIGEIEAIVTPPEQLSSASESELLGNISSKESSNPIYDWGFTFWGGVMHEDSLAAVFSEPASVVNSQIFGVGVIRRITKVGFDSLQLEVEAQGFKHTNIQNHLEFTTALRLRWSPTKFLNVAVIEGISYASAIPEIENKNSLPAQLLNYLAFETEIFPTKKLALVFRLHHRSGVNGLYGGADGGSNAYLLGMRFKL